MSEKAKRKRGRQKKTGRKRKSVPAKKKGKKAGKKSTARKSARKKRTGNRPVAEDSRLAQATAASLRKTPTPPQEPSPPTDLRKTTPEFPCICPGEKYPITRAVCLQRQERGYERCPQCRYRIKGRRPRRQVLEEE